MDKIFYQTYRDRAKAAISRLGDENALAYLEALERVAESAMDLWIEFGKPRQKEMEGYLFAVLDAVGFVCDEEGQHAIEEGYTHVWTVLDDGQLNLHMPRPV